MEEQFISKTFSNKCRCIIGHARDIVTEYLEQGLKLTLRQLYYQFVSRDLLSNSQTEYKRLGSIINDARLAGELDWDAIEDRGRNMINLDSGWDSPEDIIRSACSQYSRKMWKHQPRHVEVWIEKEALIGVIENACKRWRVPYFACKGYTSQSEMYGSGKRLARAIRRGKRPLIIHLGDHDPSGLDMTRDVGDRLSMFAGRAVEVRRIALNRDQIDRYSPPPNPAKPTDGRYAAYREEHGEQSWELDALDPRTLDALISDEIAREVDRVQWHEDMNLEEQETRKIELIGNNYAQVAKFVEKFE